MKFVGIQKNIAYTIKNTTQIYIDRYVLFFERSFGRINLQNEMTLGKITFLNVF